jgi:hypothetical protein
MDLGAVIIAATAYSVAKMSALFSKANFLIILSSRVDML